MQKHGCDWDADLLELQKCFIFIVWWCRGNHFASARIPHYHIQSASRRVGQMTKHTKQFQFQKTKNVDCQKKKNTRNEIMNGTQTQIQTLGYYIQVKLANRCAVHVKFIFGKKKRFFVNQIIRACLFNSRFTPPRLLKKRRKRSKNSPIVIQKWTLNSITTESVVQTVVIVAAERSVKKKQRLIHKIQMDTQIYVSSNLFKSTLDILMTCI